MKKLFYMVPLILFHLFLVAAASASSSPTAVVIGAGISGIAAAKTLHEAGIQDILILEATPRIGGRLMKTQFSGYTVEMGCNWLFTGGPVANPLIDMAKKLKLRTFYSDFENITSNTYKQEGGLYPKKQVEEVSGVATARDDFCVKFSQKLSAKKKDVDVSILAAQRIYNKRPPTSPLEMVIDFFYNDFEDAEPPKVTSLKHTYPRNEMVDHGEDEYFVADPRGVEVLVQYLAKQFLSSVTKDPRLKLNKVVRDISYSDSGVIIKTEDGSTYNSKYVIVSVSLGVLQSDLIEFQPKLPVWKRIAISDFSMTIYTKIFMKFPYKFWPTGPGTEFFLYSHVRRGYYPAWQHLENEYPGSNILFATVTADESRRIEQLSDEAVEAELMEILKKLFGDHIPKPESILVPRWGLNKFYKGSYSNWPANYNQKRKDQLADPVGPVYFTGEHTSNKYIGYATGAYLAGIDTANDLIECIKNKSCKGSHHKN
ncbi:polyamine oxidase 1 [Ricinus communis]|uniref:Polyamine oxidase, putative n=1 Tax=Ricinus communis TaxID=3988 RepID=B9RB41_RICCO|nr:polyamine oxidase 1 [Ricinus communis]EEF52018.1 polyamine oxidase, putative [Ricinus communis]|eukprot:XP_002511416.1 polyamine oxidase [Ricinus communis]